MATELERRGAVLDDELWSAKILRDTPALIEAVHADHLAAGADIVTSASYQVSSQVDLLERSVALARKAVDAASKPALVAASLGPFGAHLADGSEYTGAYDADDAEIAALHRLRLAAALDCGADLVAFETVPCLREARIIVAVLRETPSARAWMSFSCCDDVFVTGGDRFDICVRAALESAQVVAAGVNCTAPALVPALLDAAGAGRLIAYPNRGEVWDAVTRTWQGAAELTPYDALAGQMLRAGATIIGGCCRTTPDDIAAVRRVVDAAS